MRIGELADLVAISTRAIRHDGERAGLFRSVRHVLYLMFNEGYTASSSPDLHRSDLSGEVIRLARFLHRAVRGDPETAALLALMLLPDARRPARTDGDGHFVPLDQRRRAATSCRHVTVPGRPARYRERWEVEAAYPGRRTEIVYK